MPETAKRERAEATVFTDRCEFLAAAVTDRRKAFECGVRYGEEVELYYGLAASERQFHEAVCATLCIETERITKADLQRMVVDEFQAMRKA